jgi:hypothetical protein
VLRLNLIGIIVGFSEQFELLQMMVVYVVEVYVLDLCHDFAIQLILIDQNGQTAPDFLVFHAVQRKKLQHRCYRIRLIKVTAPYNRHDVIMNVLLVQPNGL